MRNMGPVIGATSHRGLCAGSDRSMPCLIVVLTLRGSNDSGYVTASITDKIAHAVGTIPGERARQLCCHPYSRHWWDMRAADAMGIPEVLRQNLRPRLDPHLRLIAAACD